MSDQNSMSHHDLPTAPDQSVTITDQHSTEMATSTPDQPIPMSNQAATEMATDMASSTQDQHITMNTAMSATGQRIPKGAQDQSTIVPFKLVQPTNGITTTNHSAFDSISLNIAAGAGFGLIVCMLATCLVIAAFVCIYKYYNHASLRENTADTNYRQLEEARKEANKSLLQNYSSAVESKNTSATTCVGVGTREDAHKLDTEQKKGQLGEQHITFDAKKTRPRLCKYHKARAQRPLRYSSANVQSTDKGVHESARKFAADDAKNYHGGHRSSRDDKGGDGRHPTLAAAEVKCVLHRYQSPVKSIVAQNDNMRGTHPSPGAEYYLGGEKMPANDVRLNGSQSSHITVLVQESKVRHYSRHLSSAEESYAVSETDCISTHQSSPGFAVDRTMHGRQPAEKLPARDVQEHGRRRSSAEPTVAQDDGLILDRNPSELYLGGEKMLAKVSQNVLGHSSFRSSAESTVAQDDGVLNFEPYSAAQSYTGGEKLPPSDAQIHGGHQDENVWLGSHTESNIMIADGRIIAADDAMKEEDESSAVAGSQKDIISHFVVNVGDEVSKDFTRDLAEAASDAVISTPGKNLYVKSGAHKTEKARPGIEEAQLESGAEEVQPGLELRTGGKLALDEHKSLPVIKPNQPETVEAKTAIEETQPGSEESQPKIEQPEIDKDLKLDEIWSRTESEFQMESRIEWKLPVTEKTAEVTQHGIKTLPGIVKIQPETVMAQTTIEDTQPGSKERPTIMKEELQPEIEEYEEIWNESEKSWLEELKSEEAQKRIQEASSGTAWLQTEEVPREVELGTVHGTWTLCAIKVTQDEVVGQTATEETQPDSEEKQPKIEEESEPEIEEDLEYDETWYHIEEWLSEIIREAWSRIEEESQLGIEEELESKEKQNGIHEAVPGSEEEQFLTDVAIEPRTEGSQHGTRTLPAIKTMSNPAEAQMTTEVTQSGNEEVQHRIEEELQLQLETVPWILTLPQYQEALFEIGPRTEGKQNVAKTQCETEEAQQGTRTLPGIQTRSGTGEAQLQIEEAPPETEIVPPVIDPRRAPKIQVTVPAAEAPEDEGPEIITRSLSADEITELIQIGRESQIVDPEAALIHSECTFSANEVTKQIHVEAAINSTMSPDRVLESDTGSKDSYTVC